MYNRRQSRAITRNTRIGQRPWKNPTRGKILSNSSSIRLSSNVQQRDYNVPIHQSRVKVKPLTSQQNQPINIQKMSPIVKFGQQIKYAFMVKVNGSSSSPKWLTINFPPKEPGQLSKNAALNAGQDSVKTVLQNQSKSNFGKTLVAEMQSTKVKVAKIVRTPHKKIRPPKQI